ncbi:hypothetical protein E1B28_006687 [Marasmius oreades]|uniref:Derlin n=1 Tax=Marasmius oreades TaxID=181124 RepID=A0A9P7UWP8_9AGAR|nr:uncharacterized protein E1B28_006687 [Marasmius oreades]KAG7096005.1 hypothetical protein E1B28_006687 [Marasmius oreades]
MSRFFSKVRASRHDQRVNVHLYPLRTFNHISAISLCKALGLRRTIHRKQKETAALGSSVTRFTVFPVVFDFKIMDGLITELRKIPPVTRFLCGSVLGITGPVLMGMVSPYKVLYASRLVFGKLELWRLYTSFFLGSGGINFIFEIAMLYRTVNGLETGPYIRKSGDLAWQLFFSSVAIIATSYPVSSFFFFRPLLLCLTYISSSLAPPGSQTSIFGLLTLPIKYMPYVMLAFDLLMGGPQAAAQSLPGAVVGHLWWWAIWGGDLTGRGAPYAHLGRAPRWLANWLGDTSGGGPGAAGAGNAGGVHVVPPRTRLNAGGGGAPSAGSRGGHSWGSGQRLGNN